MPAAQFHFLPDLNTFLPPVQRTGFYTSAFQTGQSVKHLVEAAGVPHTEIGQIQVNEMRAGFDYHVQDGDQIVVFPPASGQSLSPGGPRFVLDNHLGRLATYLRMLGFDCIYRNDLQDDELAQISAQQERILLSRDRRLLMRKAVAFGYCLRSLDSFVQAGEVLKRYNLFEHSTPFQRCLHCNTLLQSVSKDAVLKQLKPLTRQYYDEFRLCPGCGQIYWKGSHYEHMLSLIERIRIANGSGAAGTGQPGSTD